MAYLLTFKKAIAILFGFSIATAISCDVVCSLKDFHVIAQSEALLSAIGGQSGNGNLSDQSSSHSCHKESGNEKQRDCCQHITKDFYLTHSKQGETGGIQYLPAILDSVCDIGRIFPNFETIELKSLFSTLKQPPKTSGHYLRILMSSFII